MTHLRDSAALRLVTGRARGRIVKELGLGAEESPHSGTHRVATNVRSAWPLARLSAQRGILGRGEVHHHAVPAVC